MISEKLLDKIDSLKMPKENYHAWVEDVAKVASNIEMRDNFFQKGEYQITQFTTQNKIPQHEAAQLQPNPAYKALPLTSASGKDHEGDTAMSGMKVDLNELAAIITSLNSKSNGKQNGGKNSDSKPSAPWRSEEEFNALQERNVCLRCEKPGHISRFCRKFGPPKRPVGINNMQELGHFLEQGISGID